LMTASGELPLINLVLPLWAESTGKLIRSAKLGQAVWLRSLSR
jgi:hypothetical protein